MAIPHRLPALAHRDFRNFVVGSFVSNVGSSVQMWAINWHIYHLTHSSFMVGLIAGIRILPLIVFSLLGGVIADRHDRRKILLWTQTWMSVIAIAIGVATIMGWTSVWLLFVLVTLNVIPVSFNNPARQAMMAGLVPKYVFPNAASINGIQWRLSDILGPAIAGLLIGLPLGVQTGLSLCYALNAISFAAMIYTIWKLPAKPPEEQRDRMTMPMMIELIREGLQFVWKKPILKGTMIVDFWATLLSGAEALLPAFAVILHLGPEGYGLLAASGGIGALVSAVAMAWFPPIRRQGRTVLTMVGLYGLFTVLFGISPNLITASIFLAATGAADMISTVLRQTIRQLVTPDEVRGRMSATSMIFNVAGPRLGDLEAGIAAKLIGERLAVVTGGLGCLVVAAYFALKAKELRSYEHEPPEAIPA